MVNKIPDQGDIVWLSLNPTKGHEQSGRRPVMVLTKKEYNKATECFLMCPLTTRKKGYMTEVLCKIDDKVAVILSDQIRFVDFTARKAEYITTVSS
jgi:mRNA interferase MazF